MKHPISIDKLGSTPNVFMPLFNCWYINMYDKNTTEQSIKKIHQYGRDFLVKYQLDSLLKNFIIFEVLFVIILF